MKYCPISYEHIEGDARYHRKGLNLLNSKLETLIPLSLNAQQLRQEAMNSASKLSIQGVQAKLSARLNVHKNCFDIVDQNGTFILKPASDTWPELPANEAVTMTLAQKFGLETPIHGLIFDASNEPVYFVKRFDRYGKGRKYAIEDFAQLTEKTRETKYNSSTEKLVKVIDSFTTFPKHQRIELFKRVLFCFCTGNEDMHLKNFSLIHMMKRSCFLLL
jgi:serine/threonine-protein kinase HipA